MGMKEFCQNYIWRRLCGLYKLRHVLSFSHTGLSCPLLSCFLSEKEEHRPRGMNFQTKNLHISPVSLMGGLDQRKPNNKEML